MRRKGSRPASARPDISPERQRLLDENSRRNRRGARIKESAEAQEARKMIIERESLKPVKDIDRPPTHNASP